MSAMSIRLHCGINCSRPHIRRQPRSITRCFDPQNPVTSVNDSTVNKTCSFRPCIDIHKVRRSCCVSCSTQESTVHALHTLTLQGQVKQIVGSSLQGLSEDKYVSCRSGRSGMQWHFAFFLWNMFQHMCRGLVTNFASEQPAEYYASLYKQDDLPGGHIIMLGADDASR